jgi:hypothetical protein
MVWLAGVDLQPVGILDFGARMFVVRRLVGYQGNQGEPRAVDSAFNLFCCQLVVTGFSLSPD